MRLEAFGSIVLACRLRRIQLLQTTEVRPRDSKVLRHTVVSVPNDLKHSVQVGTTLLGRGPFFDELCQCVSLPLRGAVADQNRKDQWLLQKPMNPRSHHMRRASNAIACRGRDRDYPWRIESWLQCSRVEFEPPSTNRHFRSPNVVRFGHPPFPWRAIDVGLWSTRCEDSRTFGLMWKLATSLALSILFVGCTVNQDLMFRSGADYAYEKLNETTNEAYRLAPNDRLQLQLFSNRGQRLMAMTAGSVEENRGDNLFQQQRAMFTYRVELDGTVELPEVGAVKLAGLTLDEAEQTIEAAYESEYVDPYALLQVVNNRVLVFPGEAGQATVITLQNQNTTVIEALAQAGGVRQRGRSKQIKLIRQRGDENLVYHMDLSTVEGLKDARIIVQANDIIYVDSNPQVVREVLADVSPLAQLVTTFTSLWLTYQVLLAQD